MGIVRNIMGPPVEGNDFFGRTEEITKALELLENDNNLILAAPCRVGKTSFAMKLLDEARSKKSWEVFFIDLLTRRILIFWTATPILIPGRNGCRTMMMKRGLQSSY